MTKSKKSSDVGQQASDLVIKKSDQVTEPEPVTPKETTSSKKTDAETQQETTSSKASESNKTSFDTWVESHFPDKYPPDADDERPTINLSKYGLQTAKDVKRFILSPAGESMIGEIGAHLALEKNIEREQQLQEQEHKQLMTLLKTLLLIWYMDKEAHADDKIKELIIEQNEKAIAHAKPEAHSQAQPDSSTSKDIADTLSLYNEAVRRAQDNLAKEQALEKQLAKLAVEKGQIEAKHAVYDASLSQLETSAHNAANFDEADIHSRIANLTEMMDTQANQVADLLNNDKEVEARALMEESNGMNLQVATLKDMLAVHKGDKYYADSTGQPVPSFKDASFILAKEDKIVEENGKYYLLKNGKSWESVKDNQEERKLASQEYKKASHEVMSVKKLVHHNKDLETISNAKQSVETSRQLQDNSAEKLVIANQLTLLQSVRGSAMNPNAKTETPRPTPTSGLSTTPKPSQVSAAMFYREQLQQLKQDAKKGVTYDQLVNVANQAPGNGRSDALSFLSKIPNIPRNGPIPYQMMQALIKNWPKFGIDATKPGVTSIKDASDVSPPAQEKTAPSPLNMTPFKT